MNDTARFFLRTRIKDGAPLSTLDRLGQRFEGFLDQIATALPIEITAWEGLLQNDGSRHWTFAVEMSGPQCIQTREEIEGRLDDFVFGIEWMQVVVIEYGQEIQRRVA